jgi:hypothetical protein
MYKMKFKTETTVIQDSKKTKFKSLISNLNLLFHANWGINHLDFSGINKI